MIDQKIEQLIEEAFSINWNPFAKKEVSNTGKIIYIEPGTVNSNTVRKYKDALNDFFNRHGWDNVPEDVVGDETSISISGKQVVAIWEFQYSNSHCYMNPFGIDSNLKNLPEVVEPITKWLKDYTEDDAAEIFLPKAYKNQAAKIKGVKINTISRYVGNITLEIQK